MTAAEKEREAVAVAIAELLTEVGAMRAQLAAMQAEKPKIQAAAKLLTLRDAAAHVGIDVKTLRKAIEAGRVGTVTIQKRRMIPISALEALLQPTVTKNASRRRPSGGSPRGYSVEAELAKLKELDRCRRR